MTRTFTMTNNEPYKGTIHSDNSAVIRTLEDSERQLSLELETERCRYTQATQRIKDLVRQLETYRDLASEHARLCRANHRLQEAQRFEKQVSEIDAILRGDER
jgi:hypothetical protein